MDKLIHTTLNSIANLRNLQVVQAQNLANMNVPGFRRDTVGDGQSFFLQEDGALTSRAFAVGSTEASFSNASGFLDQTGQPLDVAIADEGWFYVQPAGGGQPALSRRGDLRAGLDGKLVNGAGDAILDQRMQPIILPPNRQVVIDDVGRIQIQPIDQPNGPLEEVTTIATTLAPGTKLAKGADGQIRSVTGPMPSPDQQAKVVQGALEGSNVNSTEELISSIDLQRSFELNLRMISTAKELDEAGTRLMRMPEG
ncbi:MAG: flagellar hook-basal body complex protein [Rhodobacteraceae bacterium]|nr:flagellar hook-basal body complex protein [Paracoccaceae bacterium]